MRAAKASACSRQGVKLINLVIHDTGQGVGNWSAAPDGEVYGCIIFYNGWDAPDRGHGHGIYAQNQTGKKYLTDNIIFRQFSYGIHGYTEGGFIDNFEVQGNIVFNNGEVSAQSSFATDILVGGLKVAQTPLLRDNATYFPAGEGANNLGYSAGCSNPTITNNYFVAGTALSLQLHAARSRVTGNTFVGSLSGLHATELSGQHLHERATERQPRHRQTEQVRRGARAHRHLQLGKSRLGRRRRVGRARGRRRRTSSSTCRICSARPCSSGVYSGGTLAVPMTRTAVTTPVGNVPVTVQHTSKEFGAFLLRKSCQ